jgi:hypothetical protein
LGGNSPNVVTLTTGEKAALWNDDSRSSFHFFQAFAKVLRTSGAFSSEANNLFWCKFHYHLGWEWTWRIWKKRMDRSCTRT